MAKKVILSNVDAELDFTISTDMAIELIEYLSSQVNSGVSKIPVKLIGKDMTIHESEDDDANENPYHG